MSGTELVASAASAPAGPPFAAPASPSGLLTLRYARPWRASRAAIRRLLAEAPCTVVLIPEGSPPLGGPVVAGLKLDETGAEVLRQASALARRTGAPELVALHSFFYNTSDPDEEMHAEAIERQRLDLLRFLAWNPLPGVPCTPAIEEAADPARALARVASNLHASAIVLGHRRGDPTGKAATLAEETIRVIVQVRLPESGGRIARMVRRFLPHLEPAFN